MFYSLFSPFVCAPRDFESVIAGTTGAPAHILSRHAPLSLYRGESPTNRPPSVWCYLSVNIVFFVTYLAFRIDYLQCLGVTVCGSIYCFFLLIVYLDSTRNTKLSIRTASLKTRLLSEVRSEMALNPLTRFACNSSSEARGHIFSPRRINSIIKIQRKGGNGSIMCWWFVALERHLPRSATLYSPCTRVARDRPPAPRRFLPEQCLTIARFPMV